MTIAPKDLAQIGGATYNTEAEAQQAAQQLESFRPSWIIGWTPTADGKFRLVSF